MTLKIVGAGLPRTGTASLKEALERLLGGRCYHMLEVLADMEEVSPWQAILDGQPPDWATLFSGYDAAVDWPASAYWVELAAAYPDAPVLLSTRSDATTWWKSAEQTVFEAIRRGETEPEPSPFSEMTTALVRYGLGDDWDDSQSVMAAYQRHNDRVRSAIPADRLVEWQPGDGWGPLCAALDVPVPDDPFPHNNTTADFRTMVGFDH